MLAQRDQARLPAGIAVGREGQPTTDPFKAVDDAYRPRLLPFGGYKGFGLALMIELLCSAGLGTPAGRSKLTPPLDSAYCTGLYFVFRPDLFVEREVFDAQVSQLLTNLERSTSATSSALRFPGEESQRRKEQILDSGLLDLEEPTYAFLRA